MENFYPRHCKSPQIKKRVENTMKTMGKILDYTEEIVIGCSMFVMILINFGNIVARYVFNASWAFSEEILIILFVYNSLLGASIAFKRRKHTGFTGVVEKLPHGLQKLLNLIVVVGIITMMIFLLYFGAQMCINQAKYGLKTSALGIPEYFAGATIPISAFLIIIRTIQNTFQDWKSKEHPEAE